MKEDMTLEEMKESRDYNLKRMKEYVRRGHYEDARECWYMAANLEFRIRDLEKGLTCVDLANDGSDRTETE